MSSLSIPNRCWVCEETANPMFATINTVAGTTLYACTLKCYKVFNEEMKKREQMIKLEKQQQNFLPIVESSKTIVESFESIMPKDNTGSLKKGNAKK